VGTRANAEYAALWKGRWWDGRISEAASVSAGDFDGADGDE
jgi:hypothetical protein